MHACDTPYDVATMKFTFRFQDIATYVNVPQVDTVYSLSM